GVKVESGVTSASLTDVRIVGGGSGKGTGVIKEGEGGMTLTSVGISNVAMGVEATAGRLEIKGNSTITFNNGSGNYGVRVKNGVTMATLTSVTIAGTGSGEGTGVVMGGKMLEMSGGSISNVAMGVEATNGDLTVSGVTMTGVQKGIDMSGSGTLTVRDRTRIEFMGEHGVKVESGVTSASLTNVTIRGEGTGKGVIKDGTGDLRMERVDISKVQTGIQVSNGDLTVNGGTISEVQTGITMSGSGTL
ncbi:hypothetical protein, partial [Bartonella bovis]|uniref:hypothetical protein n=1 Tax=Bartonella bovis TaxID=155194 RepID=UPI001ABADC64